MAVQTIDAQAGVLGGHETPRDEFAVRCVALHAGDTGGMHCRLRGKVRALVLVTGEAKGARVRRVACQPKEHHRRHQRTAAAEGC